MGSDQIDPRPLALVYSSATHVIDLYCSTYSTNEQLKFPDDHIARDLAPRWSAKAERLPLPAALEVHCILDELILRRPRLLLVRTRLLLLPVALLDALLGT